MEFRHLVSFITIAEELHFGRAAQRLHLTQPSLSAQLQKLEKSLGVQLVARNSHEVKLTPAGREFEGQARIIVAQMDRAAQVAKATAAGRAGTLNIGYNLPASRHVLPDALTKMTEQHPDIVVSLWEKRTGPQLAALSDGSLDLALVYGPRAPRISGIGACCTGFRWWRWSAGGIGGPIGPACRSPNWRARSVCCSLASSVRPCTTRSSVRRPIPGSPCRSRRPRTIPARPRTWCRCGRWWVSPHCRARFRWVWVRRGVVRWR